MAGYNRNVVMLKYLYCVTFFVLLMDRMDNVPFTSVLRKIKYVYIFLLLVYFFMSFKGRIYKKTIPAIIVLGIILVHTFLWGTVFVNDTVRSYTYVHMREILILLCFIWGTAYLYGTSGTLLEFANDTYKIYLLALLWAGLTHISNFVNPVKFIHVFAGHHAYRVTFGMGHANYVGSICCFALLCSIYLLENIRNHGTMKELITNKKALWIIASDIYIGEMLFSTASRTAILAFLAAACIYIIYNANELILFRMGRINMRVIMFSLGILFFSWICIMGGLSSLLSNSNRDNLISVNSEIFYKYYDPWIGMGYINYTGFAYGTWLYGYETANADSYYMYILFSTGYLGAVLIGLAILLTSIFIFKSGRRKKEITGYMVLLAFLVLGLAQASLISYDHIMSISFWVLLVLEMSKFENDKMSNYHERKMKL
ncbi:MAG: O-antigen ligase family protein [Lachnospiraceae bacterium]